MPLPDDFNQRAFDRQWGDAPEWESVWEACAAAFHAAVQRAFDEFPLNDKMRTVAISKSYGLFLTSVKKYMPILSAKQREKLDGLLERLMDSVKGDEKEAALEDAGEVSYYYKLLLEEQNRDQMGAL